MGRVKSISFSGQLDKAIVKEFKKGRNLEQVQKKIMAKGKRAIAVPMRNEARIHYSNVIDNAVNFIEESGIGNDAPSGNQTYAGTSANGQIVTFTSLKPWDPLSKPYAAKKRNPSMWRNKGDLAGYAQAERSKDRVSVTNMVPVEGIKSPASRKLGQFTFSLRFQKLHPAFSEMVQKAFITGKTISPTRLLHVIPMNRNSLSRVMFLERYTKAGTRGGRGRPMLTSISGTLGKLMRKDLSALKLGKFR